MMEICLKAKNKKESKMGVKRGKWQPPMFEEIKVAVE